MFWFYDTINRSKQTVTRNRVIFKGFHDFVPWWEFLFQILPFSPELGVSYFWDLFLQLIIANLGLHIWNQNIFLRVGKEYILKSRLRIEKNLFSFYILVITFELFISKNAHRYGFVKKQVNLWTLFFLSFFVIFDFLSK